MNVNNYRVKTGTLLKCWENKGCINKIDSDVPFSGILDTGSPEHQKMMKDKLIDGKILWVGLGVNWWRRLKML